MTCLKANWKNILIGFFVMRVLATADTAEIETVWYDEADIRARLEREYIPGEE